jgi:lysophospholipase L1-like esterase
MSQPYAVDVATPLTDESGELKESLTTDGLHPDAEAKKIIGEIIGKYLKEKFGLK